MGRAPRRRVRRPAGTAASGWTATPPRRSPATRRWPRSSPATSTSTRWKTWSGCAWNWTRRRRDGARDAAWAALEQAVIGKAVDLLSGPGGLASFLRRRQLGARLAGPSLPLDIGYAETIPAGIRNAVILRDRHCQWSGGCDQPADGLPGAPHQAQGQRRRDLRQGLRPAVPVPPPDRDPPLGLDPGPEPRRHHHRVEQGQDQGPPQPRPPARPG